jgi:xanthine/CO dehydrogenase XdhC/CoxF family maturation factor
MSLKSRTVRPSSKRALIPRQRAVATLLLAGEFLAAADAVARATPNFSKVVLYLYGHCLELAFKATLVCAGTTEDTLKRLGHQLPRTLRAARRQKAPVQVSLGTDDHRLIGWISHYYAMKDLEYVATGARFYPGTGVLSQLCHRVLDDLTPPVKRFVRSWLRAQRAA